MDRKARWSNLKLREIRKMCYDSYMKNWSTDAKELKKNKAKFAVWKLEQLINFGLGKEKIKAVELKKYWNLLDLDPDKKKFMALFV